MENCDQGDSLVRLINNASNSFSTSSLSLVSGGSVDVSIRCLDHEHSRDGLGAHKVVLAAASPDLLRPILKELEGVGNESGSDMVCIHLPDYTSQQVSQLMSLLYYGEVWLTMDNFSTSFSSMLSDLKIAAELTFMKSPKGGGSGLVDGIKAEAPIEEEEDIAEVDEAVETSLKAESAEVPSEDFTQPRFNTNDGDIQHSTHGATPDQDPPPQTASQSFVVPIQPEVEDEESLPVERARLVCTEGRHCNYSTTSLSSFQAHKLVHERKRRRKVIKCPACPRDDVEDITIEEHLEAVHFGGIEATAAGQKCDLSPDCQTSFQNLEELISHFYDQHAAVQGGGVDESQDLLSCDFPNCDYETRSSFNMSQHLRTHNDERNHECSVCHQKFLLSSHLKTHLRIHNTKEHKFKCQYCEKSFATNWQLKSHTANNHLNPQKSVFPCQRCNKAFYKYQSLSAHMKSCKEQASTPPLPTREKKYQVCESCGDKLEGGPTSLRRHQCVCRTGDVNLRCPICSKVLKSKSFKSHMQYHKSQEQNKNLLVCVYCSNKPFTSAVALKRHLLIHENAKPFVCNVCSKGFRQKAALTAHERVHSGIRFSCHCGKLFITKSLLTRHRKMSQQETCQRVNS